MRARPKTIARWSAVALLGLLGVAQFERPARTNPPLDPPRTLAASLHVPARVDSILRRACQDCHSSETRWPWYSRVAPVSWFVIDHVNHGRRHVNFSEWAKLPADRRADVLQHVCTLARDGSMPLSSYLLVHRDARLSADDVETLCAWAEGARRALGDARS